MKINEWLDTSGRYFSNRGLGFKTDPAHPNERKLDLDNEDPFSPNKEVGIQLTSLREKSIEAFNTVLKELGQCEEFQSSTLQWSTPEIETVVIRSCDILKINKEVKLCYVGQDLMNENGFIIRATKDSVVLKPNKKHRESKNPFNLLEDLKKQVENQKDDISHLFKNGDDCLNC